MKKIFIIIGILLSGTIGIAQQASNLIAEGNKLANSFKEKEALEKYEAALVKEPDNVTALCKASYYLSQEGSRQGSDLVKKSYFEKASNYAQKAIKLDPNEAEAHFDYALALGRLGLMASSEEKLKNAKIIKSESEKAIVLNPKHAGAHHLLGRLNREISNMSSIKVMAAKALYGGVPENCSFEQAEKYFARAMELRPFYILYYYDAALNYDYMGKKDKAKELLQKAITFPYTTPDDPFRANDCKKQLAKYK